MGRWEGAVLHPLARRSMFARAQCARILHVARNRREGPGKQFHNPGGKRRAGARVCARKMRKNALGLCELAGATPALLVSSPLTRAIQTAEILLETNVAWRTLDIATCDELRPGSEPAALLKWLKHQPQCSSRSALIALVGHEPHLSSTVSWFLSGQRKSLFELRKGGACLVEFGASFEKGRGKMVWLAKPGMLRI